MIIETLVATALGISGGTFPHNGECTIPETELYIPPDRGVLKNRHQRRRQQAILRKIKRK